MTANELAGRVQDGETELFAEIYELFAQKIYAFIFYKTFHRETAEDLTSQTFIRALEKIQLFKPRKGSFNSWIYAIARNSVIDFYRSKKDSKNIDDVFDLASDDDLAAEFAAKNEFAEIRAALRQISPRQREIILLRIWEGLKFREIAEVLEKSEAAVKMDFARGIKSLQKEVIVALVLFPLTFS
ncbi:MAG: sigma-70 family RNA polymerase sigma factor [Candidatus Peribacteraceae bacterium]|nr:sigma-70 family RNA polymerase sigma factor [Candidatus Peribacteraceae bacterium]